MNGELTPLRAGFIPLIDAAALIVAADRGFAAESGLVLPRSEVGVHAFEHAQLRRAIRLSAQRQLDAAHAARARRSEQNVRSESPEVTVTRHRGAHITHKHRVYECRKAVP